MLDYVGATGYGPITSTPSSSNNTNSVLHSSYEDRNYCPATIHLLYKNVQTSLYYCTMCKKSTSNFYTDQMDTLSPEASGDANVLDMFPENSTLRQVLDISSKHGRSKKNVSCKFCKKNGEIAAVYQSHELKNLEGKVVCPVLRSYRCSICNATGDFAHTRKYCPMSASIYDELPIFRRLANGVISTFHNHK